jgi:hypothetical protein
MTRLMTAATSMGDRWGPFLDHNLWACLGDKLEDKHVCRAHVEVPRQLRLCLTAILLASATLFQQTPPCPQMDGSICTHTKDPPPGPRTYTHMRTVHASHTYA